MRNELYSLAGKIENCLMKCFLSLNLHCPIKPRSWRLSGTLLENLQLFIKIWISIIWTNSQYGSFIHSYLIWKFYCTVTSSKRNSMEERNISTLSKFLSGRRLENVRFRFEGNFSPINKILSGAIYEYVFCKR